MWCPCLRPYDCGIEIVDGVGEECGEPAKDCRYKEGQDEKESYCLLDLRSSPGCCLREHNFSSL